MTRNLNDFLDSIRTHLTDNVKSRVIVIGNDSADLDSIISSLLFAYASSLNDTTQLYIPLVKVPKADLQLRPELKFVCEKAAVDMQKLICIDEVSLTPGPIVLIDHNHLTSPFNEEAWNNKVVGVLDHHVDEHLYGNALLRVVQMVGSSVTLVLDHFSETSDWLNDQVIQLALAPLLVDTVNFNRELNRTTDLDVKMFEWLTSALHAPMDFTLYFKDVEHAKSQVDDMSNRDILRRDYKEFTVNGYRIGTSSVPWYFQAWIDRDGVDVINEAVSDYGKERELDMEVIFTSYDHSGDYRRELAVFALNKELMPIKQRLEQTDSIQLNPLFTASASDAHLHYYQQGNIKMSRKQVWPLLKDILEESKL
ncbi:DHH phosphoesterase [Backusella circina FSU 941]|nr:DHH phosphoesterase [Backusella circina FSU 941]